MKKIDKTPKNKSPYILYAALNCLYLLIQPKLPGLLGDSIDYVVLVQIDLFLVISTYLYQKIDKKIEDRHRKIEGFHRSLENILENLKGVASGYFSLISKKTKAI